MTPSCVADVLPRPAYKESYGALLYLRADSVVVPGFCLWAQPPTPNRGEADTVARLERTQLLPEEPKAITTKGQVPMGTRMCA